MSKNSEIGFVETTTSEVKKKKPARIKLIISTLLVLSLVANGVLLYFYVSMKSFVEEIDTVYSSSYFYFDSLTVDSFKEKVKSGEDFLVVISRPNCSSCQTLEEPFIKFALDNNIADKIYHLNVVLLRRDDEAWMQFKETYGLNGTPTYARYSGGQQISRVGWTPENGIDLETVKQWLYDQTDLLGISQPE